MKTTALRHFRQKLADHKPVNGLFISLESASITDMAVAIGLDWVVIDAEHGHLDWREIDEHIRAGLRSQTVMLVRLADGSTSLIKRALDIGADGVVIPWIETAPQIEQVLRDCHYPPQGRRGIGSERATVWGQCFAQHAAEANDHVLVVPVIESLAAIQNVPEMCRVNGVELFLIGPADLSATAGSRGEWEGPGVAQQVLQLKNTIQAAGKHCGILATSLEDLEVRRDQGFRMLGLASDSGLLFRGLHQALQVVDADRKLATSLNPTDGQVIRPAVKRRHEQIIPSRGEVVTRITEAPTTELQSGVTFAALVGGFNGAQNLTTGIVTIIPEGRLDYHAHAFAESITVLEGELEVLVEGRAYQLGPLDNVTIPRWLPHSAKCAANGRAVRVHVALATSAPDRELVSHAFPRIEMPSDSSGVLGFERVTRFDSAIRTFNVGKGAEFIDYFNAELIPGLEFSGGFGRFHPKGRLPAHIHDFDESISIIRGDANCLVEGRRYSLNELATAMVPRGRVHYFVNESSEFMDMIWVYAGPMPERILVDETFQEERQSNGLMLNVI